MKKHIMILFAVLLGLSLGLQDIAYGEKHTSEDAVEAKYISYEGVPIYTEVYNASAKGKEPLIFLHGLGGSYQHAAFLHQPDNPYKTISFDFINHGKSGDVSSLDWDIYVDNVKAVMDAYGIKKANLVGHSFGADITMMFAKKYPERVKDIVIIDRAYYNYKDIEQFNLSRKLLDVLEYNPESGLKWEDLVTLMEMQYENDITQTWDIKKKVLLIAGDFSGMLPDPTGLKPSLVDLVVDIKQNPGNYGLTTEEAAEIPYITAENIEQFVEFVHQKSREFASVNHKFKTIKTSYPHTMIRNEESKDIVREYVISFLKNGKVKE
ncbi:MAG: alpha/beta fold hydrolase [Bacillota bacterium]